MQRLIALDPGQKKCGLAVFDEQKLLHKEVVVVARMPDAVSHWYTPGTLVVVGNRTGSKKFISELQKKFGIMKVDIVLIDEDRSTMEARARYWEAKPPKGWRSLIPLTMQEPPEPIDDFVAVILAERYFRQNYSDPN